MPKTKPAKAITTDVELRKLKPTGEEYRRPIGNGLSIIVRAKGAMLWQCDTKINGTRLKVSYGNYPDLSLASARKLHDAAVGLAGKGLDVKAILEQSGAIQSILQARGDTSIAEVVFQLDQLRGAEEKRQADAKKITFGEAATAYYDNYVVSNWKNPEKGFNPVYANLLPRWGGVALDDMTAADIRSFVYELREKRGVSAAHHALGWLKRIFAYAVEHELCTTNTVLQISKSRIGPTSKRDRWATVAELRRYLTALYQVHAYRGYKLALHLLLILATRKNELCGASWPEIDFEAGEWRIPSARMKNAKDHLVFLPAQAVEMLQELRALGCGSEWVMPMPSNNKRPMHPNNLDATHKAALLAANIDDYLIHDHRHTASTQLREKGHVPEVVEAALSHTIPGIAGVYAHAEYRKQRREMLQEWADFLDQIVTEKNIVHANLQRGKNNAA